MDPVTALERIGGVSGRSELLRVVTRHELDRALERGTVRRVSHNLYALPAADAAVVAARRHHGTVSHLSAALGWGWKVRQAPPRPTITVSRNRHPDADAGVDVRFADLDADDTGSGRTSPVRTVLDCARCLPFPDALSVADSALRAGAVTTAELVGRLADTPRTGRSRAARVVECATAKAANPFESTLRAEALDVAGLRPEPQGDVAGIGHADLVDHELRIAIEAESFAFHALEDAFRYDIRRYTAMTRAGWLVARFVWEDVMRRPSYVRAVLADYVALRAR